MLFSISLLRPTVLLSVSLPATFHTIPYQIPASLLSSGLVCIFCFTLEIHSLVHQAIHRQPKVIKLYTCFKIMPLPNISNLSQPSTGHSLSHSYTETLEELKYYPIPHIQQGPLPQAIYTWYTDGSSFLHEGAQRVGYAIMSDKEGTEAWVLQAHTTNK